MRHSLRQQAVKRKLASIIEPTTLADDPGFFDLEPITVEPTSLRPIRIASSHQLFPYATLLFLAEQYPNDCVVIPMDSDDLVWDERTKRFTNLPEFKIALRRCLRGDARHIVFLLGINTSDGGHANAVLFDRDNGEVEVFEPFGVNWLLEFDLEALYRPIADLLANATGTEVQLFSPMDFCPRNTEGVQMFDHTFSKKRFTDPWGYCQAWSLWWIEQRLKHPDIPRDLLNQMAADEFAHRQSGLVAIRRYADVKLEITRDLQAAAVLALLQSRQAPALLAKLEYCLWAAGLNLRLPEEAAHIEPHQTVLDQTVYRLDIVQQAATLTGAVERMHELVKAWQPLAAASFDQTAIRSFVSSWNTLEDFSLLRSEHPELLGSGAPFDALGYVVFVVNDLLHCTGDILMPFVKKVVRQRLAQEEK